ncbi:hypothetical protein KSC_031860 [Ktedonobacter sp. SOSP1-52]|nr:hypothetical protein KSC_031860 [Ktedonobacter sp. SOSP1-52]
MRERGISSSMRVSLEEASKAKRSFDRIFWEKAPEEYIDLSRPNFALGGVLARIRSDASAASGFAVFWEGILSIDGGGMRERERLRMGYR